MAKDIDWSALGEKTTINIHYKGGDSSVIHSADNVAQLVHSMTGTLSGFLGFKDVRGSFIIINVSEILSISLYSVENNNASP